MLEEAGYRLELPPLGTRLALHAVGNELPVRATAPGPRLAVSKASLEGGADTRESCPEEERANTLALGRPKH
eukprot:9863313-Alexandrium_andersonii.AAC.1